MASLVARMGLKRRTSPMEEATVLRQATAALDVQGHMADTLAACQAYVERSPAKPWGYVGTARILLQMGRPEGARTVLECGVGRSGRHAALYYWLARCHVAQDGLEAAIEAAEQAVRRDPEHRHGWCYLGGLYERQGRPDRALDAYARATFGREDALAEKSHRAAGRLLLAQSRPDLAVEQCGRALAVARNRGASLAELAAAYADLGTALLATGREEEAANAQQKALKLEEGLDACSPEEVQDWDADGGLECQHGMVDDGRGITRGTAHYGSGTGVRCCVEGAQALASWEAYVEDAPTEPWGYIGLARILLDRGRPDESQAVLRQGLVRAGAHAALYHWLSRSQTAARDPQGALEAAEQAVQRDPGYRQAWYHLGGICEQLAWPWEALSAYQRAAADEEDHLAWLAYRDAGRILKAWGRPDAAAGSFERAAAASERPGEGPRAVAQDSAMMSDALLNLGRDIEAAQAQHTALMLEPAPADVRRIAILALVYLGAITAAELVTALSVPGAGLVLHAILLVTLLLHSARRWGEPVHRLLLSLSLAPLIRLLSLSLPLAGFPLLYQYLIISVPLLVATVIVIRILHLRAGEVGLTLRYAAVQLAIALLGLAFGWIEYGILQPDPLTTGNSGSELWLASLILLLCTGFVEELIFRGVMQWTAIETLGNWGMLYAAVLFAVLHVGYLSVANVVFVFGVALVFGATVLYTGSIVGVTLAHGLTNIVLFLVMPLLRVRGWG